MASVGPTRFVWELVDPKLYDYSQTGNIGVIYRDDGWLKDGYRSGLAYDIVALKRNMGNLHDLGIRTADDADEDFLPLHFEAGRFHSLEIR